MSIIALLTDFGGQDNFIGVMKGVVLGISPQATLVDITHRVYPYDTREGAFLLWASYRYFPPNTVFVAVVDPGVGSERIPLAIKTSRFYFVGPDNGVLSVAAKEDGIETIVAIENQQYWLNHVSDTFHGRDIFAPAAAYISQGIPITSLGSKRERIAEVGIPTICRHKAKLEGEILYIDTFGNLVTNIRNYDFNDFAQGRMFIARLNDKEIKKVCRCYADGQGDEPFLIEGSFGFLEVALNQNSAKDYFGISNFRKGKVVIKIECSKERR